MDYSTLPAVNATLNATCTVLLLIGYRLVKQRRLEAHRNFMIAAGIVSTLFLTSYLIYHYHVGSVKFQGQGAIRPVYFAILLTHIVLAIVIAVLVPMTFWRAFTQQIERHRALARITFPIWMYVSVTGVVIYVLLYKIY